MMNFKIYVVVIAIVFSVVEAFCGDWQTAGNAVFRLSCNGKTIGSAFLYRMEGSEFFITAAHVLEQASKNEQMYVDLATEHNDETLKIALQDVIPLLKKEGIVVPDGIEPMDILVMPAQQLLDKLLAKKNFTPSAKLAGLSLKIKLSKTLQEKVSGSEKMRALKQLNRLLLQERFPGIFTERPVAILKNPVIISQRDDLGIFTLEDLTQIEALEIKSLKGSNNHNRQDIVNLSVMVWSYSYFPPFITDDIMPARGHILKYTLQRMFIYSVPMTEGSSGSPVVDEDGRVMGIVLSQINSKQRDENTGIFEVLPTARLNELLEYHLMRLKNVNEMQSERRND